MLHIVLQLILQMFTCVIKLTIHSGKCIRQIIWLVRICD